MTVSATTGRILLDVAVILIAARAGGVLFERMGQPSVIGEIAAGIALGPTLGTRRAICSRPMHSPCCN